MIHKRFAVDVERGRDYAPRLGAMAEHPPAGHVRLTAGFGFSFQREIDVFGAVAIGTSLGMGILLTVMATRMQRLSYVVPGLAGVAFLLCLLLVVRFVVSRGTSLDVCAEGDRLRVFRCLFGRRTALLDVPSDAVVAVEVRKVDGDTTAITLGGPRHELLGEVYRLRLLDPESLGPYLAEMTAIVARYASAAG